MVQSILLSVVYSAVLLLLDYTFAVRHQLTLTSARPHGGQVQPKPVASQTSQTTFLSRGICDRLSHWLWPTWWGSPCELPASPRPIRQPYDDCKACREWHVDCDHARPQCSHCCQEQLLCFYVDPTTKPKPRPKIKRRPDPAVPILGPAVPPARRSPAQTQTHIPVPGRT